MHYIPRPYTNFLAAREGRLLFLSEKIASSQWIVSTLVFLPFAKIAGFATVLSVSFYAMTASLLSNTSVALLLWLFPSLCGGLEALILSCLALSLSDPADVYSAK